MIQHILDMTGVQGSKQKRWWEWTLQNYKIIFETDQNLELVFQEPHFSFQHILSHPEYIKQIVCNFLFKNIWLREILQSSKGMQDVAYFWCTLQILYAFRLTFHAWYLHVMDGKLINHTVVKGYWNSLFWIIFLTMWHGVSFTSNNILNLV